MNRGSQLVSILAGLALTSGCASRVSVAERDASTNEKNLLAAIPATASLPEQPRMGPITGEWAAAMELNAGRMKMKAPVAYSPRERAPFDNNTLVYAAANDRNDLTDTAEGLVQVSFGNEGADFDPRVSRDGQFVVFASTQHRPTADIYVKRVNSKAVTQLTADPSNDVMPAISPDGRRVAFVSDRNGAWQVFVMNIGGGKAVQVTDGSSSDLHPTWSPDGKRLAFCRLGQVSGRWELWTVEASNPAAAEFIGFGMFPEWCPVAGTGADRSDTIVFQRGRERGDRSFSLWTVDYKPGMVSSPTEIVSGGVNGRAAINPTWSPDGKFIAYSTVKTEMDGRQASDVWLAAADGSATINITGGVASNLSPFWGRDGRIYFVSDRAGRENIWCAATDKALAAMGVGSAPALAATSEPKVNAAEGTLKANPETTETTEPAVTAVPSPQ